MIRKQLARFVHSPAFKHYARTTVNPVDFRLTPPSNVTPKSVLVFSTPTCLPSIIQDAIDLHQTNRLQVVVAGIDTMVPFSSRNGVSELWLEQEMKIGTSVLLEEKDDINKPPRESDGINPVSARKNWKDITGSVSFKLKNEMEARVTLANTVFSSGSIITLFYFDSKMGLSGQHLCELSLELPHGVIPRHSRAVVEDHWTPLYPNESFKITKCVGNLLKQVENKPAAKFLEENNSLVSLKSKDTEVYVKVRKQGTTHVDRFKVVAGGGGWGAKADIIALSAEAQPSVGDLIEFYMVTPQHRFQPQHDVSKYHDCFALQSSYEETSYGSRLAQEQVFENAFGCGSEKGFFWNGVGHVSPGETVFVKM
ncbi:uncharacterized protein LODBEIA_P38830 [Lodderomyces beijingensis]|uniref:FIST domain-containing protein n=1 Tax=Lodderomyces beijingensis TaxID=1775926 RepID=A0ABP0ZNE2_9ASCO